MTGLLSTASRALEEMIDSTADWASELLRRTAADMGHALDQAAQRDVEGADEWRNLQSDRRYQS